MKGEAQTWHRSDDSIHGTWVEVAEKIYMNFDHPEEDQWNSGIYKGFRIFAKVKNASEYWECIKPAWKPSTKMIKKGVNPPWINEWDKGNERKKV